MKQLQWFLISLLLFAPMVKGQSDQAVEIMVMGRQPGPPMWRVFNGDNTLWIFPQLSPVPKGMIWESNKVAEVIAQAQEVLEAPDIDVSASRLVMLNPVNIFRGMRLAKRLSRNPDKQNLATVLPADLYARFSAVKAEYFPRDKELEALRPLLAGTRLLRRVQREEDLVSSEEVMKEVNRLIRRNRSAKRTQIELEMKLEGGYKQLAARAEAMADSLSPEQELVCFETQLARAEHDIREMKIRANAWAQGYIDEFRGIPLRGDNDDPCLQLILGSSEFATIDDMQTRMNNLWLDAAEQALKTNRTTFAVLEINQLVLDNGLLAQLKARGYEVREP